MQTTTTETRQPQAQVQCKVERIVYPKDDGIGTPEGRQFYIMHTSIGSVKGQLSWRPVPGERLVLVGKWQVSKFNGSQEFSFTSGRHDIPRDERSMLTYACELTKGIGSATEQLIWDKLGEKWREVSVTDCIPHVTAKTVVAFQETIEHLGMEKEKMETISYVMSKGATIRMSEAAWGKWALNTISKIEENCYVLAELNGFSFKDVDSHIREAFGIGIDDKRRISAAALYFMAQLSQSSTLVPWRDLNTAVRNAINAAPVAVCEIIKGMFANGRLVAWPEVQGLSTDKNYEDEKLIWDFVTGVCG